MGFTEMFSRILEPAGNHPLVAIAVVLFLVTTVVFGLMHQAEIAGEIGILLIRMFKHHVRSLLRIGQRLRAQLTTWDDPVAKEIEEARSRRN